MNPKHIGKIMRFHRKKSGLTQEELGLLAGVGKTVVFDIEKGKLSIRLSSLLKLLKVLNICLEFKSPILRDFHEES